MFVRYLSDAVSMYSGLLANADDDVDAVMLVVRYESVQSSRVGEMSPLQRHPCYCLVNRRSSVRHGLRRHSVRV